ncbi:MAG: hypothetical protein HY314_03665 [Acidobacteria bacterium]|nr:hypothetical protein [Acidobacteriota bacterium]
MHEPARGYIIITVRKRSHMDQREEETTLTIIEWDPDAFHQKVAHWEALGYQALRHTYQVKAEIHPETDEVMHQYTIMMQKSQA